MQMRRPQCDTPLVYFAMSQFDWAITQKNETLEAPQNVRFYFELHNSFLWPNYVGERRATFAKADGRKVRC
jgi:hypothetical protein